jgi:uncharacterized coiled-coil DUF342 family protein
MEIQQFIRSKMLPNSTMFKLFDIVRGDNIVEDLINYTVEILEEEVVPSSEEIEDLEREIKSKDNTIEELQKTVDAYESTETNRAEKFQEFIERFQEEHDRYPSIDEAWETAWEIGQDNLKK